MAKGNVVYVVRFARAIADNMQHATDEQLSAAYIRLLQFNGDGDQERRNALTTEINRRREMKEAKGWDPRMK